MRASVFAMMSGTLCAATLCGRPSSTTSMPAAASAGVSFLEHELALAFELRMRGRERLTDEVHRCDAGELDLGVQQQASDELAAAITRAADDGCAEALSGLRLHSRLW